MKKTTAILSTKPVPAKKNLFGLSPNQLKLVVGGTGVVVNGSGSER